MRLDAAAFAAFFTAVNGHAPLPWQTDLAARLLAGEDWPAGVDVATGLGKTSLIDIAVFAAAAGAPAARRRIFFVVDRRLVVDEAYDHARTLAAALAAPTAHAHTPDQAAVLAEVAQRLDPEHGETDGGGGEPLEVARMRGGTTWDWRWVKRPDAHAVVVGTVDQIGSRLLMRGYGLGPHLAPIDAALVGTDSLIVCDEAHLSAPLLRTLHTAVRPADRLAAPVVLTMSATAPPVRQGRVHTTTAADEAHPVAGARLTSPRKLHLLAPKTSKAVADQMAAWAHALGRQPGPGRVVLTVCNTVARARAVFAALHTRGVDEDDRVLLIGRCRPVDRDHLIATAYGHMRLGRPRVREQTLHVVATQTVEVGANIDADALVSESASYSALVQRLGRLGRAPDLHRADRYPAVVVHDPATGDDDPVYGSARNATWAWLGAHGEPLVVRKGQPLLEGMAEGGIDASPRGLAHLRSTLSEQDKKAMETPDSYIPHLWQGTIRLWSRTSPRPHPDPPVAPYLHGIDGRPADVTLLWRADLAFDQLPAPGEQAPSEILRRIAALPPSSEEMLSVSAVAVRRWATGGDPAGVDDVESGRAPEPSRTEAGRAPVVGLAYTGDGAVHAVDLRHVHPGETVIVPAAAGGCDSYGWNPQSRAPVTDVADLARRRDRPRLRLHPRLAGLADERTAPAVTALLAAHDDAAETGEEPEASDFTDLLTALPAAPGGEPWSRSQRLAASLRLLADGKSSLIETGQAQWVLARRARPVGSDTGTVASSAAPAPVDLETHQQEVARQAARFAANLGLPETEVHAVWLAGRYHDEGKRDPRFQAMLYGLPPEAVDGLPARAKSGLDPADARAHQLAARRSTYPTGMRHEALSVAIARVRLDHERIDADTDLVLHLIAAHHGRARPLVAPVTDPAPVTVAVPGTKTSIRTDALHDPGQAARFDRLQDAHGTWKLALLEAVVRLADIWCSAGHVPTTAPDPHIPRRPSTPHPGEVVPEHRVALPALDGRDPLGFLAALGTLRLLTEDARLPVRLSFDPYDATAHITGPLHDTDAIAHTLAKLVAELAPGQLFSGMPAEWPPRLHDDGRAGDPLRVDRAAYPALVDHAADAGEAWLRFITTDLGLDARGRCALTPFMAPAGRQTAATFFSFPLDKVQAEPHLLTQALTGWRRVDHFTGEYLDHRAIRTAGDLPTGESTPAGVPGATWLATHALPLLHLTGDTTRTRAALWHRIQGRTVMRWPVWEPEHDLATTRALITHPVLNRARFDDTGAALCIPAAELSPLGITVMAAAQRIPGRNSAGPLAPLDTRLL